MGLPVVGETEPSVVGVFLSIVVKASVVVLEAKELTVVDTPVPLVGVAEVLVMKGSTETVVDRTGLGLVEIIGPSITGNLHFFPRPFLLRLQRRPLQSASLLHFFRYISG